MLLAVFFGKQSLPEPAREMFFAETQNQIVSYEQKKSKKLWYSVQKIKAKNLKCQIQDEKHEKSSP